MDGRFLVEPGQRARIARRDTRDGVDADGKEDGHRQLAEVQAKLAGLHNRLWAEATRSALLILQGLDASGKDGVIRSVFTGLNPQGVRVVSFKAPTSNERAHDYLWRVHKALPVRGEIGIFNRSHYEDYVAVRMLGLAPKEVWGRRPGHFREWERMLVDEGTAVVKVFLNVSKDEQRRRLQERVDDPAKRWKFRAEDLEVRKRFDDYLQAWDDVITETSTEWAPWHVVPADRNWVKALAVAEILCEALERLDPRMPPPADGIEGLTIE
ncbi:MAG TPA: PPK2 family polyphosphate kinase [Solirubrobacteraceae bacterium]|jgi:PPK2 family polyphosphate:nucleotide phosphotransferase|nr:PPK2 family polyphosphate kinase [Solirubrobacteraceae bacterium]